MRKIAEQRSFADPDEEISGAPDGRFPGLLGALADASDEVTAENRRIKDPESARESAEIFQRDAYSNVPVHRLSARWEEPRPDPDGALDRVARALGDGRETTVERATGFLVEARREEALLWTDGAFRPDRLAEALDDVCHDANDRGDRELVDLSEVTITGTVGENAEVAAETLVAVDRSADLDVRIDVDSEAIEADLSAERTRTGRTTGERVIDDDMERRAEEATGGGRPVDDERQFDPTG